MKKIRLTMAQALLRFLDAQYVELDRTEHKFVHGVMGIFGHGNVTGIGEALEYGGTGLRYIQGHNEQGLVHAATAFAKQKNRLGIYACTSSIGPGATNMITGAAAATVNRIPVLLLPGDTFADRQPDPVLQQIETPWDYTINANSAFKPVSRYWDRIERPEQLMVAGLNAMRVLTDPVETGAVTLCLPQDTQAEAYDYPESFFAKRIWHLDRRPLHSRQLKEAVALLSQAEKPLIIAGGGVHEHIQFVDSGDLVPLQQTGPIDIITENGKLMPSLVNFLPEVRGQLPPNGTYDMGIRRDTPIEIIRQVVEAFLAAVNSTVFKTMAEQQRLLIDVLVGEEADRRAAELEAITATMFQELGIPGAKGPEELGLPEADTFEIWWPPEDYVPLSL